MIIDDEIEQTEYKGPGSYPNIKQSIGLGLYFLLFSVIADLPVEIIKAFVHVQSKTILSVFTLMAYAAGAIATIWFGFYRYRQVEGVAYKYKFNKVPVIVVIVSVLMVLTMPVLTDPVTVLIPMSDEVKKLFADMFDPNIISYITVILVAPILEETIFRGIILNGLLKKYSPETGIVVSAAIFAAIHLNPWQAIPAFLGGLLMGWMYWKTRSIIPGMILHFANNLFSTILGVVYKDADTIKQLVSTPIYIVLYLGCAAILFGGWIFLEKYFEDNPLPQDDEWEPELTTAEED
jgi:membrane protease YdiL (CAAX protease family)